MKIIIATNFDNRRLVTKYSRILKQRGHEVYDWTTHKSIRPYKTHEELAKQYSQENINAILNSDVFILLNSKECRSSYIELGIAIHSRITKGKPKIYVVGEKNSVYFFHSTITYIDGIEQLLLSLTL